MTQTAVPNRESWVPAKHLQEEARRLGISNAMLQRLRTSGLLARPNGPWSPPRALAQLEAIAAAQLWTKDACRIRHTMWWTGAPLEDWNRWRDDQVLYLRALASYDDHLAHISAEERDREAIEFAAQLASDRSTGFPRRRITQQADRESVAAILLALRARDFSAVLFDQDPGDWPVHDPSALLESLRRNLATAVDDNTPTTIGDLLGVAMRAEHLPEPGVWVTLFMGAWMPDGLAMPDLMMVMTEDRAAVIRDLLRAGATNRPEFDLERRPELAGMLLLTFDRMAQHVPALLDRNNWPVSTAAVGSAPGSD